MDNICFKGDLSYGSRMIEVFENNLGGINQFDYSGDSSKDYYYLVDGIIMMNRKIPNGYMLADFGRYNDIYIKRLELTDKVVQLKLMLKIAGKHFPELMPLIRKELQVIHSVENLQTAIEARMKIIGK